MPLREWVVERGEGTALVFWDFWLRGREWFWIEFGVLHQQPCPYGGGCLYRHFALPIRENPGSARVMEKVRRGEGIWERGELHRQFRFAGTVELPTDGFDVERAKFESK